MRQLLSGLLSILLVLPTQVFAVDAPTPEGVTVGTASVAVYSPNEASPTGFENIPTEVKSIMAQIGAMPARVAASGGALTMPSYAAAKKAETAYVGQRPVCFADQSRASMVCREETSPNLQSTLQGVNLVMSGINSLAVNDACKGFSKAMSVAQAGITAYTAACGLLRKKCNMSCTAAGTGFKTLATYVVTQDETCVGPPSAMAECAAVLSEIKTLKAKMDPLLSKDGSASVAGTLHNKSNLCQHTYGMLLASAGASILSLANSVKQGQQCDEESDATGGTESTASTPATGTTTTPTQTVTTGSSDQLVSSSLTTDTTVLDPSKNSGSGLTGSEYNIPVVPGAEVSSSAGGRSSFAASGSAAGADLGSSSTETAQGRSAASVSSATGGSASSSELASGSSGGSSSGSGGYGSTDSSEFANSAYREYLPGGEKDPSRSVAGQEAWRKEVTGAGGKSNWAKMQDRYKSIKTLNDD